MTNNYYKYTGYIRYVDFKRLDFIIQSIKTYFDNAALKGLDLGCGRGDITFPLAFFGYKMIGIDISPDNIEAAEIKRKYLALYKHNPTFSIGDAENLGLEKESFDFVVLSEVLEHLKYPEKALTSINVTLKDGGLLIVTVPNGYGPYSLIYDQFRNKVVFKIFPKVGISDHVQAFTLPKICNLIKEVGFEVLKINHSDFISFLPLLVKSNICQYYDCKLADKLSAQLVSGYYIACRKK